MRILLIEDETGIANLIREGLEEANYKVDVAADGQTGLRMACEQTYHLILLDIMLPGRDGWSVCEELRARRDRVPILMLTARDGVRDRIGTRSRRARSSSQTLQPSRPGSMMSN